MPAMGGVAMPMTGLASTPVPVPVMVGEAGVAKRVALWPLRAAMPNGGMQGRR